MLSTLMETMSSSTPTYGAITVPLAAATISLRHLKTERDEKKVEEEEEGGNIRESSQQLAMDCR
jgi:hypothetical protein